MRIKLTDAEKWDSGAAVYRGRDVRIINVPPDYCGWSASYLEWVMDIRADKSLGVVEIELVNADEVK